MRTVPEILEELDRMIKEDQLDLDEYTADKVSKSPAARVTLGRIGALSDLREWIEEETPPP